jgi:alpha-acetolactate decarboxylase
MNCPEYDPDAYGCMSPLVHGRCPNTSTRQCENGWLSFWTPAERAGLKAMGWHIHIYRKNQRGDFARISVALAMIEATTKLICAYVQAARKVKT